MSTKSDNQYEILEEFDNAGNEMESNNGAKTEYKLSYIFTSLKILAFFLLFIYSKDILAICFILLAIIRCHGIYLNKFHPEKCDPDVVPLNKYFLIYHLALVLCKLSFAVGLLLNKEIIITISSVLLILLSIVAFSHDIRKSKESKDNILILYGFIIGICFYSYVIYMML